MKANRGLDKLLDHIAFLAISAPIALMFIAFWLHWPKDGGEWAAWVQAIGSVAAIYFAVLLGKFQIDQARNTRLEDQREIEIAKAFKKVDQATLLEALAYDAHMTAREIRSSVVSGALDEVQRSFAISRLNDQIQSLATILTHSDMQSFTPSVVDIKRHLFECIAIVMATNGKDNGEYEQLKIPCERLFTEYQSAKQVFRYAFEDMHDEVRNLPSAARAEKLAARHAKNIRKVADS